MVLIHVKKSDDLQFFFEAPAETPVSDLIPQLVDVWNRIVLIRRLADGVEELAKYGVSKPPEQQGIDHIQDEVAVKEGRKAPTRGPFYIEDPTGRRTGEALDSRLVDVMTREVANARKLTNCKVHSLSCFSPIQAQVEANVKMSRALVDETWHSLRGAVLIAYPQGLPAYDDVQQVLEENYEPDSVKDDVVATDTSSAQRTCWTWPRPRFGGRASSCSQGRSCPTTRDGTTRRKSWPACKRMGPQGRRSESLP